MVTPLPAVDKMRRYLSMNILDHQNIIAQESADFRSVLKWVAFPHLYPGISSKVPKILETMPVHPPMFLKLPKA